MEMSESLRDCVNTTQDDVSNRYDTQDSGVRAHDEKCPNHFAIA